MRTYKSSALVLTRGRHEGGYLVCGSGLWFPRRWVLLLTIRYSTVRDASSRYAGSFSIIPVTMMPKDQMQTFALHSFCLTTAGTIWCEAPIAAVFSDF